jgi:hypothetical protein
MYIIYIAVSRIKNMEMEYYILFLLLHRAFWRFTEYCTPTNALIVCYILV